MKTSDLERLVKFPPLSRKEGNKLSCSIGLSDWSTHIRSSVEDDLKLNHFVQIQLLKGHEDIKYEVLETDREILITYHWKDYDPTEDNEEEEQIRIKQSILIFPPEGTSFKPCGKCGAPCIDTGRSLNCIWCDLGMEENDFDEKPS